MFRQGELRRQLEATERELANQKWVFERFLESPAWRMTYPVRWLAQQARRFVASGSGRAREARARQGEASMNGGPGEGTGSEQILKPSLAAPDLRLSPRRLPEEEGGPSAIKELLTTAYRANLNNFLSAEIPLRLPHSDSPEVSIILILFNRAELTLQCLRSIADHGFDRLEVIIVDNASTDETAHLLSLIDGAVIIRNTENRHFVLGVNQAARDTRGEFLLLLNNDAQLLPGALRSALNTIRQDPAIGAVGGRLIMLDWSLQEAGSIVWRDGSCLGYGRGDDPFAPAYMFRRDVDYCSAAFLLTPRATWQRLGGFDEAFKPAYYEDSDYCARLWEQGFRVVYDPNAMILHYEFGASNLPSAIDLQIAHQKLFESRHQKWLSNHHPPDPDTILPARMKKDRNKRILFIEDRVPHPWLGSGFPRARNILLSLVRQGLFVTFYPLMHLAESWDCVYSDMPNEIEFMIGYGPALLESFFRYRYGYYDIVFVSRPHNMKILRPILSSHRDWFRNTTVIYDAEALFAGRELTLRNLDGNPVSQQEAEKILKGEVELARVAHTVISVSDSERNEFEKHGIKNVHVVGHSVSPVITSRTFRDREGFLFVGAVHEEVSPNGDSIIWFLEKIFPRIQAKLGHAIRLTIAGVNTSERVRQLAGGAVRITGQVRDLTPLYDSARVFIAPTRYSAGIPQKVHDAAARGVPIVATPLLASQLGWRDGSPLLVAGDAETFAEKCVQLHTDEALWYRLRESAVERIRVDCSPELFEERLRLALASVHSPPRRGRVAR
ncbi:MAG: glycosyl transferase family 2 [Acidobacteria bacterium]|nr:MAG: glycosyl transferase family 2 [Acidobacteriota bacterium]